MDQLLSLFSVNTTFFTLGGYPMSYLEFFGTLLNLASVYLVAKNKIWSWPIGNVAVILFGILFFQIQLYSDFVEQIYFFITGFYGWWIWLNVKRSGDQRTTDDLAITRNSRSANGWYALAIILGTAVMGYVMGHIHLWLPAVFAAPASFAYLDAFTTVLSFAATILLAHKKVESWYLWILVDIIGIGLYFTKGVVFIALLYAIFLVLATRGLFSWRAIMRRAAA